jgi:hypothetical protein
VGCVVAYRTRFIVRVRDIRPLHVTSGSGGRSSCMSWTDGISTTLTDRPIWAFGAVHTPTCTLTVTAFTTSCVPEHWEQAGYLLQHVRKQFFRM